MDIERASRLGSMVDEIRDPNLRVEMEKWWSE